MTLACFIQRAARRALSLALVGGLAACGSADEPQLPDARWQGQCDSGVSVWELDYYAHWSQDAELEGSTGDWWIYTGTGTAEADDGRRFDQALLTLIICASDGGCTNVGDPYDRDDFMFDILGGLALRLKGTVGNDREHLSGVCYEEAGGGLASTGTWALDQVERFDR